MILSNIFVNFIKIQITQSILIWNFKLKFQIDVKCKNVNNVRSHLISNRIKQFIRKFSTSWYKWRKSLFEKKKFWHTCLCNSNKSFYKCDLVDNHMIIIIFSTMILNSKKDIECSIDINFKKNWSLNRVEMK